VTVVETLAAVTAALAGAEDRPGQRRMAELVEAGIESGRHVVVQAGTGTGKTLAYLVPAIEAAVERASTVGVATATKALQDQLAVKDLRDAWNSLSADRLGLVPASDVEGCLQDIHWAIGSFGHFPSYGVGAVIAGQLWETIREQQPGIEAEIAQGQFGSLMAWLRERVHSMGASLGVPQLVQHATGRPLSAAPFLRYLERKYLADS
jgi:hypothetical protein